VLISLINNILSSRHYDPKALDDSFSETVFEEYMEDLDYGKRFFLASDVEALAYYSSRIDEEMVMSGTELFDSSTAVLLKRQKLAESWVNEWLSAPFDYEKEEFFEFDGNKRSYAKSQSGLKEVWRKYLKSRVLSRVYERLSGQEKDTADRSSFEEIEQKARSRETRASERLVRIDAGHEGGRLDGRLHECDHWLFRSAHRVFPTAAKRGV
jgi:carboxyl-terminal processing protease